MADGRPFIFFAFEAGGNFFKKIWSIFFKPVVIFRAGGQFKKKLKKYDILNGYLSQLGNKNSFKIKIKTY